MLRVPIEQVRPKMVLAHSVFDPKKPDHTLLKGGFKLDEESLASLRSHGVRSLWVRYPELGFLDDMIDPAVIKEKQELYTALKTQFSEAQEVSFAKLNYQEYVQRIGALFQMLLSNVQTASVYLADLHAETDDLFAHGVNVATISLILGMNLETHIVRERPQLSLRQATDLTSLGVGAILHDIGKIHFPEEVRAFRLTAQDRGTAEWQAHTEAGFEMIKGGLDATASQVIINHHQQYDGKGFPARKSLPGNTGITEPLAGSDIHVFCRIVAMADRFESFRHLPDGSYAPAIVALKRLRNPGYASWFDPAVYEAFFKAIPPFSLGEQVQLNNGQYVVVAEFNDGHPYRPVVKSIDLARVAEPDKPADEEAQESVEIDLLGRADLHIAKIGNLDVTSYLL